MHQMLFDGWLLPAAGKWITGELGLVFDYRNNLHSFGLVIIALIANQFWKTGLLRGLVPMAVTIGVTFLIVRYGLMTFTNFTISSMSYMYEDIAGGGPEVGSGGAWRSRFCLRRCCFNFFFFSVRNFRCCIFNMCS